MHISYKSETLTHNLHFFNPFSLFSSWHNLKIYALKCLILSLCVCLYVFFLQRVALSFDFPFYGHYLRQIIVATGGTFDFPADVRVTFPAYVQSGGGVL